VLRNGLALARGAIEAAGVTIHPHIPPGATRVRGDSVQLLQIVLNLIVNGCEAMHATPTGQRDLWLQLRRTENGHVDVMIADAGSGLPDGDEERVFDPFFTTKEKGLGLGLSIARSIAMSHGGSLWAENNQWGGASFHLTLPIVMLNTHPPAPSDALAIAV